MEDTVTGLFRSDDANESWCFNYSVCTFKYVSILSSTTFLVYALQNVIMVGRFAGSLQ